MKIIPMIACGLIATNLFPIGALAAKQKPTSRTDKAKSAKASSAKASSTKANSSKANSTKPRPMSTKMQLIDVLRHQGKPRTEYFLDLPTAYGKLRLDLTAAPDILLGQTGMTDEMRKKADQDIEVGLLLKEEFPDEAERELLTVITKYPYYARTYEEMAAFYSEKGKLAEAEYQLKQLIALKPTYYHLMGLGQILGRRQRYDEAILVERYLWDKRATASAGEAVQLAMDYLVTLSRVNNGKAMIAVAETALKQYGASSAFQYQYVYGYYLDNQFPMAKTQMDAVLAKFNPQDPLYGRFKDLEKLINDRLPGR